MNKFILLLILAGTVFFLSSCTQTCTCEDRNYNLKEYEIDPSENCSDLSDAIWTCS